MADKTETSNPSDSSGGSTPTHFVMKIEPHKPANPEKPCYECVLQSGPMCLDRSYCSFHETGKTWRKKRWTSLVEMRCSLQHGTTADKYVISNSGLNFDAYWGGLLKYYQCKFVVESTRGSYTETGWTYITSRDSLNEAKNIVDVYGPEGYRVYDKRLNYASHKVW